MKRLNKDKKRTIAYCDSILKQEERDAEKESIKLLDTFKNKRKHAFRNLRDKDDEEALDKCEKWLLADINKL